MRIFNYTDIEILEEVLESEALDIKKEVDINEKIDGNYCDICYAGTKPDFTSLVGTSVGAFTFNKLDNKCWRVPALSLNSPKSSLIVRATLGFTCLGKPTDRN